MPWRLTGRYAWSEIEHLDLRQKVDADEAKIVLTLTFTSRLCLRPETIDSGNHRAYLALKTSRDRARRVENALIQYSSRGPAA